MTRRRQRGFRSGWTVAKRKRLEDGPGERAVVLRSERAWLTRQAESRTSSVRS